ncbi:hypothetical protein MBLNU230_g5342t1 [Neophaeotheca triangularis]
MAAKMLADARAQGYEITPHPIQAPQPRTKSMEVLCLGLSRTGTMSLYLALNKLGLNCYHATEAGRDNSNGSLKTWVEGIEAKYLYGPQSARLETPEHFDRLLWRYQAVTDIPAVLFADELLAAYPDAKVILTERDESAWVRSMQNSFYKVLSWKSWPLVEMIDSLHASYFIPQVRHSLRILTSGDVHDMQALRRGYQAHNAHIRAVVPDDRLLVYHVSQGWEPLCKFLDKPVPREAMPNVNEALFIKELIGVLWWMDLLSGLKRRVSWVVLPVVLVGAAWFFRGSR